MCQAQACAPESQEPSCQGFPLILPKLFTQVDQPCLGEPSHTGGPLRMPPVSEDAEASLSAAQPASLPSRDRSLIMFTITFTYRLAVRDAGSSGPRGSCPTVRILSSSSSKCLCTLVHWHSITESTIHVCLQGSQENPAHHASGSPCRLARQTGTHRL